MAVATAVFASIEILKGRMLPPEHVFVFQCSSSSSSSSGSTRRQQPLVAAAAVSSSSGGGGSSNGSSSSSGTVGVYQYVELLWTVYWYADL